MTTSRTAARRGAGSAGLALGLAGVVLALVLFARPDDGAPSSRSGPAPTSASPSSPADASEEAFCAGFRKLAAAQTDFVVAPEGPASELLREAADRLVEVGVPRTMTLPARSGYFTVIDGIYQSLDATIDPAAVGALDEPVAGGDKAFASYLIRTCPA